MMLRSKMLKIKDLIFTNLATNTTFNVKINEVKNEISSVTDLVTNASLNAKVNEVKNKIPNINNLAATTALTAVENKIPDHNKSITTPEFNKLTTEHFTARLKQTNLATKGGIADFVKKTDFDDKLKNVNKEVTSNKSVYVLVENDFIKNTR